jgi:hypothetical protein
VPLSVAPPLPPTWDDVVCATSRPTASPVCDEVALLGFDGAIYRDPGSTAARVWALVRQPVRVAEIHRLIVAQTGLDPAVVRREVLAVLSELQQAALVEVVGRGEAR